MTQDEHNKEVQKLGLLEDQLMKLIFNINNDQLIDTFTKWQEQRTKCNEGFMSYWERVFKDFENMKQETKLASRS